ncbi:WD repeat-containing protein 18 isoform X1 [Hyalella azteca]|uniref:WD repeat-containing protein 18 isoform X1 n=1 Tax=Hyalella azteca TaxID=294128 RepID=A0A8B7N730_HYAAZ|nr:WD repeat-containing protein 18 isoform X1 [Hyalella azteca]
MYMMEDLINAVIVTAPNLAPSSAYVYDVLTGTTLHSYKGQQTVPGTLCTSGPEEFVFAACKERSSVLTWQLNRHELLDIRLFLPGRVTAMDVSPTPPTMLVAAIGEVMHVFNLESGSRVLLIKRHFQPVTSIAFFPCGAYFASAGADGFMYVWSVASIVATSAQGDTRQNVQPHKQLGQHSDKVTCMHVSGGTEGRLISGSADHTCRVYDLYTLCLLYTIVLSCEVTAVHMTLMATRIIVGTQAGQLVLLDISPYQTASTIRLRDELCNACHEGPVSAVQFLLSGTTVVSAGDDGEVKVWAVEERTDGVAASFEQRSAGAEEEGSTRLRLTLQRTLHRNKGPVSNMRVLLIDRKQLSGDYEDRPGVQELASFQPLAWMDTAVTVPPPPPAMRTTDNSVAAHLMRQFTLEHCHDEWRSIEFLLNR